MKISFRLNGKLVEVEAGAETTLLELLRDHLGLKGTKEGCGVGECGACTVLMDGLAVDSCLLPAARVHGRHVETVEGLSGDEGLSKLQEAFIEAGAVQCGYCTPGMLMSAEALLRRRPNPTDDQIVEALEGNLCRCTGYQDISLALRLAPRREPETDR